MHAQWFSTLKGQEKEDFKDQLLGSKKILDILREIVYNKSMSCINYLEKDFDKPSWSHRNAFELGKKAAYEELIQYLTIPDVQ